VIIHIYKYINNTGYFIYTYKSSNFDKFPISSILDWTKSIEYKCLTIPKEKKDIIIKLINIINAIEKNYIYK